MFILLFWLACLPIFLQLHFFHLNLLEFVLVNGLQELFFEFACNFIFKPEPRGVDEALPLEFFRNHFGFANDFVDVLVFLYNPIVELLILLIFGLIYVMNCGFVLGLHVNNYFFAHRHVQNFLGEVLPPPLVNLVGVGDTQGEEKLRLLGSFMFVEHLLVKERNMVQVF